MSLILTLTCSLILLLPLLCQQSEEALVFEVASVKRHQPSQGGPAGSSIKGGPGTDDPGRITISNRLLRTLIIEAYGIRGFQIEHPSWVGDERFDIVANVPPGTTKQQANVMIKNLLVERFHLQVHREPRQLLVYDLMVAKKGLKMRPSASVSTEGDVPQRQLRNEKPGISMNASASQLNAVGIRQSLPKIVAWLTDIVGRPVFDTTELIGEYDFALRFDPGADLSTDMFSSLQDLGLKLEPRKISIEMVVVDSALRIPTEN
jgi:uncharacterized protein (TIGR03435 family)